MALAAPDMEPGWNGFLFEDEEDQEPFTKPPLAMDKISTGDATPRSQRGDSTARSSRSVSSSSGTSRGGSRGGNRSSKHSSAVAARPRPGARPAVGQLKGMSDKDLLAPPSKMKLQLAALMEGGGPSFASMPESVQEAILGRRSPPAVASASHGRSKRNKRLTGFRRGEG